MLVAVCHRRETPADTLPTINPNPEVWGQTAVVGLSCVFSPKPQSPTCLKAADGGAPESCPCLYFWFGAGMWEKMDVVCLDVFLLGHIATVVWIYHYALL